METIMKEYSGHSGRRQGRCKLKDRVLRHYGKKLIFLKPEYHAPELVIGKECLSGQIFSRNSAAFKEFTVQTPALLLRESIVEAMEHAPTVPWPPTVAQYFRIFYEYFLQQYYQRKIVIM